jgi:hypothetical protein
LATSLGLRALACKPLVGPLPLAFNLPIEFSLCSMKLLLSFCDRLGFLRGRFPGTARVVALPLSPLKLAARAACARCTRRLLLVASGFPVESSSTRFFCSLLQTVTFQLLLAAPDSALGHAH